jgi:single-strand DNA-binding protein
MSLFGDLNEVRILGNITQDPELRYTSNGNQVCSVSVATNRRYKQQDEWKDATEFHNIVIWGNLAQQVAQRSKKGTRVMISGRLQTRSWEGQDGQKKYKTEIVADDVFLIDRFEKGKTDELPPATVSQGGGNMPASSGSGSSKKQNDESSVDPDDLPF